VSKRPDAFSRNTIKAGHAQKGLVPKFSVKKPVRNLGSQKSSEPSPPRRGLLWRAPAKKHQSFLNCVYLRASAAKKSYVFASTIPRKIISSGIIPKTKDIW
jgi:hypothetical protein